MPYKNVEEGKIKKREYYYKHKEELKKRFKLNYEKNREKRILKQKKYYVDNSKKCNERTNKYYHLHKKEISEKNKQITQDSSLREIKNEKIRKHNNLPEIKKRINENRRKNRLENPEKIRKQKKEWATKYYSNPENKRKKALQEKRWVTNNRNKIILRQSKPIAKLHKKLCDLRYYQNNKNKWNQRSKDLANGKIITPKVLEINNNLEEIKDLYFNKNWDTKTIAIHLKTNQLIILAVLRRNGLPVKPKAFHNQKFIECSNGLMVKSNSERRIVEILLQKNIPFEYEKPIKYANTTYFPDFYFPNQNVLVEYAGLMDKEWYAKQIEKKKMAYKELNLNAIFITKPEQIKVII